MSRTRKMSIVAQGAERICGAEVFGSVVIFFFGGCVRNTIPATFCSNYFKEEMKYFIVKKETCKMQFILIMKDI